MQESWNSCLVSRSVSIISPAHAHVLSIHSWLLATRMISFLQLPWFCTASLSSAIDSSVESFILYTPLVLGRPTAFTTFISSPRVQHFLKLVLLLSGGLTSTGIYSHWKEHSIYQSDCVYIINLIHFQCQSCRNLMAKLCEKKSPRYCSGLILRQNPLVCWFASRDGYLYQLVGCLLPLFYFVSVHLWRFVRYEVQGITNCFFPRFVLIFSNSKQTLIIGLPHWDTLHVNRWRHMKWYNIGQWQSWLTIVSLNE